MKWIECKEYFHCYKLCTITTIDLANGDILTYTKVQSKIFLKLNVKLIHVSQLQVFGNWGHFWITLTFVLGLLGVRVQSVWAVTPTSPHHQRWEGLTKDLLSLKLQPRLPTSLHHKRPLIAQNRQRKLPFNLGWPHQRGHLNYKEVNFKQIQIFFTHIYLNE